MTKLTYDTVVQHEDGEPIDSIEFTIKKEEDLGWGFSEEVILRFHPKYSHVHGFENDCPDRYRAVYKEYLAYDVIKKTNDGDEESVEILFDMPCDECSALFAMQEVLDDVLQGNVDEPEYRFTAAGDGAAWIVKTHYVTDWEYWEKTGLDQQIPEYEFFVFRTYDGVGYRFMLAQKKAVEFRETIISFLKEALAHSESI